MTARRARAARSRALRRADGAAFSAADRRAPIDRHGCCPALQLSARDRQRRIQFRSDGGDSSRTPGFAHKSDARTLVTGLAATLLSIALAVACCAVRAWPGMGATGSAACRADPCRRRTRRSRSVSHFLIGRLGLDRARVITVAHRMDAAAGRLDRRSSVGSHWPLVLAWSRRKCRISC